MNYTLPPDAARAVERLQSADLVVGIPSYNNARTIGHVVRAAQAGLAKHFPNRTAVIVNSDGGSHDGTREAALAAALDDSNVLFIPTPTLPVHRLSFPYHGIPGKGSAFRMIFAMAQRLGARGCAVIDSDLRSIRPEWVDLLLRPVVEAGHDFVAPYYHRHKYDGTITNSIVYPLTRALYGVRIRQPIGGDFGISGRLVGEYLQQDDWETDVARYGIDIWMTTIAIAGGFRVCQSFLGAKLHDAKDPGTDLSAMLHQVVGSVFTLMGRYERTWAEMAGSAPAPLFGFRYDVGLEPVAVDVDRMLASFVRGSRELREIWALALQADTLEAVLRLARQVESNAREPVFQMPDALWFRVVADFASAHHSNPVERGHMLNSMTPLYLARTASFVIETARLGSAEVEEKIEGLCRVFEENKPYLISNWMRRERKGASASAPGGEVGLASLERR